MYYFLFMAKMLREMRDVLFVEDFYRAVIKQGGWIDVVYPYFSEFFRRCLTRGGCSLDFSQKAGDVSQSRLSRVESCVLDWGSGHNGTGL